MNWISQKPNGDTRLVSLSHDEVAIIAEQAVMSDSTLVAMGILEFDRPSHWPGMWTSAMGLF